MDVAVGESLDALMLVGVWTPDAFAAALDASSHPRSIGGFRRRTGPAQVPFSAAHARGTPAVEPRVTG
jgi:hypothetical protein